MLAITTIFEHIGHWIKMRQSLARFSGPEGRRRRAFLLACSGFIPERLHLLGLFVVERCDAITGVAVMNSVAIVAMACQLKLPGSKMIQNST
jgi:hypothetical protein